MLSARIQTNKELFWYTTLKWSKWSNELQHCARKTAVKVKKINNKKKMWAQPLFWVSLWINDAILLCLPTSSATTPHLWTLLFLFHLPLFSFPHTLSHCFSRTPRLFPDFPPPSHFKCLRRPTAPPSRSVSEPLPFSLFLLWLGALYPILFGSPPSLLHKALSRVTNNSNLNRKKG